MTILTCSVPGCDKPVRFTGLCGAHHQRKLRHGDVQAHIPLRGNPDPSQGLWCSSCETTKPCGEFHRNRATKSGYDGVCILCVTERRRRQATHRRIVSKAWRAANRERLLEQKRAAYHRNPQASTESGREWRRNNPDKLRLQIKAQNAARYARLKGAEGYASPADIQARWDYYGGKCWMCGEPATDTDHVKPLAVGGSNWPSNLRPSCSRCNRSKSATWPYAIEVAKIGSTTARREVVTRATQSVPVHSSL